MTEAGKDCVLWRGRLSPEGYGVVWISGRQRYAHREAYEHVNGQIRNGLEIDHLCRNRACVNPGHMEPVTRKENILRGESPAAKNARKAECHVGHPFTPENTYPRRNGRECIQCRRDRENAERRALGIPTGTSRANH
jgi:hypothetical protein